MTEADIEAARQRHDAEWKIGPPRLAPLIVTAETSKPTEPEEPPMSITDDNIAAIQTLDLREPELQACLAGFLAAALRYPSRPIVDALGLFVRATEEHPEILRAAQAFFDTPEDKPQ